MVVEQREESRRVVRKLTLVPVGSRNVDGGALVTADGETTSMVPSVELHRKTVASKAGKGRRTSSIVPLLPSGSLQVGSKMPRRENFGVEGVEGDEKFEAEMMRFSLEEFGESHAQQRHALQRMRQVGLFGDFLERHNFGQYFKWVQKKDKAEYAVVAVDRDGEPRVVSPGAIMQYMLVQARAHLPRAWRALTCAAVWQATADATARPKGGTVRYRNGKQYKRGLHGKRQGDLFKKSRGKFGFGPYSSRPMSFVHIEKQARGELAGGGGV